MNNLSTALERLKHDIRMTDILIKHRTLTTADVDKHIKSLPDDSDKAVKMDFKHDGSREKSKN